MSKILILGAHAAHGFSMRRYTELLSEAYEALGQDVKVAVPPRLFSRRLQHRTLVKFASYFECFVLFPILFIRHVLQAEVVHVVDHSSSIWLLYFAAEKTSIVTCHDLIAVRAAVEGLPEYRPGILGTFYQRLVLRGLKRATLIQAVSDVTREDVGRYVPNVSCVTVRNPLSPDFERLQEPLEPGAPFALVVSSAGWRKRRERGIEVWGELRASLPSADLHLRVVGSGLTASELAVVERSGLELSAISVHQNVTDSELARMYRSATVLIQMSKYEGFCWPILEANSQGTVALCADEPILRETGAGNFFISNDLCSAELNDLAITLSSNNFRSDLMTRAREFSASSFHRQLARCLREITR